MSLVAQLFKCNVIRIKENRVWFTDGKKVIASIQDEGNSLYTISYPGISDEERNKRYTIEEIDKRVADLL